MPHGSMGEGFIKKVALNFTIKIWWLVVRFYLYLIVMENLFIWDGLSLIERMMDVYHINFIAIIRYKLNDWAFGDMMGLSFPCLLRLLYDDIGVP